MRKIILDVLGVALALYLFGFLMIMGNVVMGGDTSDALSQHYRGVIIWIIELIS